MPHWTWIVPLAALSMLAAGFALPGSALVSAASFAALIGAVISAVHHAEVVAHRVGEPFGTLVLAIAITVIEVALIVTMMITSGGTHSSLPRDTVFAAIMIICNGVLGVCLLVGGIRHHEQAFRAEGSGSIFACLIALTTLSLVLPGFTTSVPGPIYSGKQLAFASIASLVLYGVFVFVQTVRHRDYFLPATRASEEEAHAPPPAARLAWISFALLLASLVAVVGLAKSLAPMIERAVQAAGAPETVIGIAIALLVLLPETWAALRAALADRLQTSLNLALGSALASIGLSIPAVALAAHALDLTLVLGLGNKDIVLLLLTFLIGTITLTAGKSTVLQGALHMVIFAAYLFLAFAP